MNNASTLWLSVTFGLLELATTWWLQATILLAIGLLTAISLRKPVWQSLVFRVTIASVLFSPLLAQLLLLMGCPLLTIDLDSRHLNQQDPTSRIDAVSPAESTASELKSVAAPTSLTTLPRRQRCQACWGGNRFKFT